MSGGRILRLGLAAGLLLGLGACDPSYDGISVRRIGGHLDADIDGREMSVPEGGLVVFEPELRARSGAYDALDELHFESHDPGVARVVQGLETGTWMLLGSREGSTALDVIVNGELEDSISVRITRSQEGSP